MQGIDLYSGIGGWSLGFRAAGAEIVRSYEIWPIANATHGLNHSSPPRDTDIRRLALSELPEPGSMDFVTGSPPCTQFSYANRGGGGDLADGLVDIRKFLEIVRYLRPSHWAMENVPRVAGILSRELAPGGGLSEFADLVTCILVVDASTFGLPQARKRMLAGNFDSELLLSYRSKCAPKSLGDVLEGLSRQRPFDPNWGDEITPEELTDHVREAPLSEEEKRMNLAAKTHHAVYNRMAFPDRTDRPARTVTATCTRVSRESIVIPEGAGFRRLTIRERALLQGFPITYQFASGSYADRAKMVGNAAPPVLTYYVANAMAGTTLEELVPLQERGCRHCPREYSRSALPERAGRAFPVQRSFRFAIPGLRFHSGVRFEFRNRFEGPAVSWEVDFYYGSSKQVVTADLSPPVIGRALEDLGLGWLVSEAERLIRSLLGPLWEDGADELQSLWSGREDGDGPFSILDGLGEVVSQLAASLVSQDPGIVLALFPGFNRGKVDRHWREVLAGAAIASVVNSRWGPKAGLSDLAVAS